ncbi:uncharacterized protein B0T15DRAFT_441815 [Chaetomium strumarium]|uniref:Geranylgeranyl pyrophosphate synthetase n=1 Tax=Chaetomium strumarium TaxID=1170767 RepID=A0AAJ0GKP6_9PEZI|nr:hypothetical protein B0T15DRAFT_441815 [Chaetomium strumarium]
MASSTITSLSHSELASLSAPDGKITGVQHLASYNWLERPAATISVPGGPPRWSPPSHAPKLTPDAGTVYIDQNAARNPRSPLEPLFLALYTEHPDFNIGDVDLVTDRNNIRKLLRFVQGSSTDPFQIRVEVAGKKTALFTRVEERTTETIQGFRGYGHSFEKAYTKGQSDSAGHHRIVSYAFGGLRCIVRHEVDGYVHDKKAAVDVADDLGDAMKKLAISKPGVAIKYPGMLSIEEQGNAVDLSTTLEIKTRASHRALDMADVSPQLWISQTPRLVVGYHRRGVFDDVRLRDMTRDLAQWETRNQKHLSMLAGLLKKIIDVVGSGSGDRRALVKYEGGSVLKIVTVEGARAALPEYWYPKWETKEEQKVEGVDVKEDTEGATAVENKKEDTDQSAK